MEYRQLGKTDLKVSALCLGTMTWGEQNTQSEAFEQLDYATSQGINFIDTAEMYPVPPRAQTYAATEAIIGNWLKMHGRREKVILATKVVGPGEFSYIRDGSLKLDSNNIISAVNDSLRRLQTDYIDLYQLHWPDRKTNYFGQLGYPYQEDASVPIETTLSCLNDLKNEGKIRHIGVSNESPWGVAEFLRISRQCNLPRIVSIQNPYNLLNRTFEIGLAEFAHREKVGLLAYSPLAFGVLSGKYRHQAKPKNARLTLFDRFTRYNNPYATAATEKYVQLATSHHIDPAQMALAFVSRQPFLTSNIIGATSLSQLKSNIDSLDLELSNELIAEIEAIHKSQPNPSP